jgi:hypothetical protein
MCVWSVDQCTYAATETWKLAIPPTPTPLPPVSECVLHHITCHEISRPRYRGGALTISSVTPDIYLGRSLRRVDICITCEHAVTTGSSWLVRERAMHTFTYKCWVLFLRSHFPSPPTFDTCKPEIVQRMCMLSQGLLNSKCSVPRSLLSSHRRHDRALVTKPVVHT